MGHVKPVIAVTGTRREAMVLAGLGVEAIAGGGDSEALARELARLAPGCAGLISFGMAGGIDRSLHVGDWVVGKRLIGAFATDCDPRWAAALVRAIPDARLGAVHADGRLLSDPYDKQQLSSSTAALVVDMESHLVGEAAARAGVPFAILRCVSDRADDSLPPAVEVMMRPDGSVSVGAMLGSVARYPGQVPGLIRTLAGFKRAYDALGEGARLAGPRLGLAAG